MMLLAQSAPTSETASSLTWLILMLSLAAVFGLVVAFLVILFRHLHAVRLLSHAERMRSLEAGFPLEASDEAKNRSKFMHNAFWIAFWLVFAVPGSALSAAATATGKVESMALVTVIWGGAAMASIAAVVSATVLMLNAQPHGSQSSDSLPPITKPFIPTKKLLG